MILSNANRSRISSNIPSALLRLNILISKLPQSRPKLSLRFVNCGSQRKVIDICRYLATHQAPSRHSDSTTVCLAISMHVSILLCLVVACQPRFYSDYLAFPVTVLSKRSTMDASFSLYEYTLNIKRGRGLTLRLLPRAAQKLKLLPRADKKFHFWHPITGRIPHFNSSRVDK